eukprot:9227817-Lingulodinium_polyedra.AAC.1
MPCAAMPCHATQCYAPRSACLPALCACSSGVVKVAAAFRCASARARACSVPPRPPFYLRFR